MDLPVPFAPRRARRRVSGVGRRDVTAAARGAVLVTMLGVLGACDAGADGDRTATPSGPPAAGPTLSATLYQGRMDVTDRKVKVRLRNDGDDDVTVRSMSLAAAGFEGPMPYAKRGSRLDGGRVVDMPVTLGAVVCDEPLGRHTVRVDYQLGDGRTGTVEVPAADDRGQVAELHAAECFGDEVREVAAFSVGGPEVRPLAGQLVADLVLEVAPGARTGDLDVVHVGNTTLLQLVDPRTGEALPAGYRPDVPLARAGTTRVPLAVVPGRCDPHAVAEDKQGTLFRVTVVLDGREGQVTVASPPEVTTALYDFVRQACSSVSGP